MTGPAEVWLKGENSLCKYWGYGQTVTVLEMPRYDDERRFLCMTDALNKCKHVKAVKAYLQGEPPVLV